MEAQKTCPSREFLVRQAVLNATARMFPGFVAVSGAAASLEWCFSLWGDFIPDDFHSLIRREFHAIASRYQQVAA